MSHILVKWVSSSLWDVYNVRAIVDTSVSLQLLMDANANVNLRGTVVAVNWKEGEPAADAELLDFGLERTMERRRTRLVRLSSTASDSAEEVPREENAPNEAGAQCACSASQQVKELENEVRELRKRLEVAENMLDSYDMVKKLRKILRKTEKDPSPAVEAERVNIGGGVLVEKTLLERLHSHCQWAYKGSNANKNSEVKEALDPVRVNAVIGYTCSKFVISTLQLKNSLSSMLARELR
ncbi:hypothetical protein MRX96_028254 [Rhipicephalus microplus]